MELQLLLLILRAQKIVNDPITLFSHPLVVCHQVSESIHLGEIGRIFLKIMFGVTLGGFLVELIATI